jgi:hypothetical protein
MMVLAGKVAGAELACARGLPRGGVGAVSFENGEVTVIGHMPANTDFDH